MSYIQTEVLPVDPIQPDSALIEYAATLIKRGELVVFPTETVYGLGADALRASAVEGIFAAKGRPFYDPLIVHIADEATLPEIALHIPEQAHLLAQTFWPGPLTLILPAGPRVPGRVTAALPTVAVRMPRHPVALALIRAAGTPIAAPSANRFMHVSPTTAQHVLTDLNGRVPLILDAGPCEVGVESTILDLTSKLPTILRPGGISLEALQTILPQVQPPQARTHQTETDETGQKSPGQLPIHYAPSVPTYLYAGDTQAVNTALLNEIQRYTEQGWKTGLLLADEDKSFFHNSGATIYTVGSAQRTAQVASQLYAGLRSLEQSGVQVILCRSFSSQGLGLAIQDRLVKAAGGKVIYVS